MNSKIDRVKHMLSQKWVGVRNGLVKNEPVKNEPVKNSRVKNGLITYFFQTRLLKPWLTAYSQLKFHQFCSSLAQYGSGEILNIEVNQAYYACLVGRYNTSNFKMDHPGGHLTNWFFQIHDIHVSEPIYLLFASMPSRDLPTMTSKYQCLLAVRFWHLNDVLVY